MSSDPLILLLFGPLLTYHLCFLSTEDWSLTTGGTTPQKINASMTKWLTGPKQPGLVILEHELSDQSVQAFIDAYPVMKSNGWNVVSVARMDGQAPYQNSPDSTGDVVPQEVALLANNGTSSSSSSSTTPSGTSSTSSSGLPSGAIAPTGGASLQHNSAATTLPHLANWQVQALLVTCLVTMLSTVVMM